MRKIVARRTCQGRTTLWFMIAMLTVWAIPVSAADLKIAAPFVDHMVLQRGKPIQLWGTGPVDAEVTVRLRDQKTTAKVNADGSWRATVDALPAGGPFDLSVASGNQLADVHDVLIGEVWLCSGQSNIQMSLRETADGAVVAAVPHLNLRLGKVSTAWTATPQSTAKVNWTPATEITARQFSAVAYTFAHELENDPAMANVPIGLLEDCLGGTVVESWIPRQGLAGFDPKELQSSMFGIGPTLLYNGMIAPLGQSSYAGVIWYQGEGNAGEPDRYTKLLPILFKSWREQFHDPELPFLVVQLPDYATETGGLYWQWIRDAQARAVAETPNTALAISINTNDGWDLHPQAKHEIGRRLALLARRRIYKENVAGYGPVYQSQKVEGSKLVVSFDTDGDGLTAGFSPVNGFAIAGADENYHAATAVIEGDSVTLTAPEVPAPVTARYAWAGVPGSTLTNRSGLPAAPFRTDTLAADKHLGEPQRQLPGYSFKGENYQAVISGEGRITSLTVSNQQLLSNAPGNWGGTSVGNRNLSKLRLTGPNCLVCSNNETSLTIDFKKDAIRLTITNTHPKEAVSFHAALNPAVEATAGEPRVFSLKRKSTSVRVTGIDRAIVWHDVSADDGQVLELAVPKGETKTTEWSFK